MTAGTQVEERLFYARRLAQILEAPTRVGRFVRLAGSGAHVVNQGAESGFRREIRNVVNSETGLGGDFEAIGQDRKSTAVHDVQVLEFHLGKRGFVRVVVHTGALNQRENDGKNLRVVGQETGSADLLALDSLGEFDEAFNGETVRIHTVDTSQSSSSHVKVFRSVLFPFGLWDSGHTLGGGELLDGLGALSSLGGLENHLGSLLKGESASRRLLKLDNDIRSFLEEANSELQATLGLGSGKCLPNGCSVRNTSQTFREDFGPSDCM